MTTRPYVAGVDTSTQSCKVVIYDPASGSIIRQGKASHPDGTEVDPAKWWDAFLEAVDEAGGLDDVAALSVGGQQHGMVLLDEDGEVIRPALLWNDTRSASCARDLIRERGNDGRDDAGSEGASWWADATGSVPVASLTVTKLRWIADNEPENVERIAAICLPHDYLAWRIMGSPSLEALATDRSDASGTGYMARETPEYRRDILASALRIDADEAGRIILPAIAGPWDVVGHGDPERGWGEILIGPGAGDNAAAALGVELEPGSALLSLGTSGVVSAVSTTSIADASGLVTGFSDASGNWLPLACTLNASRIIDAMMKVTGLGYKEFDEAALSVEDAAGLVLVPYFEGERTPNLPDATASLSGMTLANSDRAHVARATVEGLLTLMRFALDAMRAQGAPIEKVLIVGGGAKSTAVQALAAQFLDAAVELPEAGEYVALGAAKQAAKVLAHAQ
ncbi:xylulokinase [Schaalia hyovaginalis]|uniref:xylulokinase n=1 Tax=Schaalia hyovaginalis TaxID=29316 RepID=UPI0026F16A19|nr:FGGY family carbohydrate kinase [Schaalia hyovaginalis]MCI7513234.1 FGGY family carbohydrate kinase [Schaalia hyovaginalis]MDY3665214.1 FGGY family carbohydrate kinase [Schaalia hyovaginalis]